MVAEMLFREFGGKFLLLPLPLCAGKGALQLHSKNAKRSIVKAASRGRLPLIDDLLYINC